MTQPITSGFPTRPWHSAAHADAPDLADAAYPCATPCSDDLPYLLDTHISKFQGDWTALNERSHSASPSVLASTRKEIDVLAPSLQLAAKTQLSIGKSSSVEANLRALTEKLRDMGEGKVAETIDNFTDAMTSKNDALKEQAELMKKYTEYFKLLNDYISAVGLDAGYKATGDQYSPFSVKGRHIIELSYNFANDCRNLVLFQSTSLEKVKEKAGIFTASTVRWETRWDTEGKAFYVLLPTAPEIAQIVKSVANYDIKGIPDAWEAEAKMWTEGTIYDIGDDGSRSFDLLIARFDKEHAGDLRGTQSTRNTATANRIDALRSELDQMRKPVSTGSDIATNKASRALTQYDSFQQLLISLCSTISRALDAYKGR